MTIEEQREGEEEDYRAVRYLSLHSTPAHSSPEARLERVNLGQNTESLRENIRLLARSMVSRRLDGIEPVD